MLDRAYFKSETALKMGIDNHPDDVNVYTNLITLDRYFWQRMKEMFPDASLHITSGYRTPEVNKAVGGVANSQHCAGQAIDFKMDSRYWPVITLFLKNSSPTIDYDQVIVYTKSKFIHASYRGAENNRRQYIVKDK